MIVLEYHACMVSRCGAMILGQAWVLEGYLKKAKRYKDTLARVFDIVDA